MRVRIFPAIVVCLGCVVVASAQDVPLTPPGSQTPTQAPAQGSGSGGRQGQRGGGRGGWGGGGGMMGLGRGLIGTATEVAADHYTIKIDTGEIYTVHFSANTRIMKQGAGMRGSGAEGGNPPLPLKPTDIKVGDVIAAMGEIDPTAKSVGAVMVVQIDPERAKQMREMQANYGKTWLMGKVTAIDGVKVTIMGAVDNAAHDFVADENTTFRKRREPITLADIQVGDNVRVEGAIKDGAFVATTVSAMGAQGPPPTVPRDPTPSPQTK